MADPAKQRRLVFGFVAMVATPLVLLALVLTYLSPGLGIATLVMAGIGATVATRQMLQRIGSSEPTP